LEQFCSIDDADVMMAIKNWCSHSDKILSYLCKGILDRQLLKVKYVPKADCIELQKQKQEEVANAFGISMEDANWLVFSGEAKSSTYDFDNAPIHILYKNGTVKNISDVDNALINESLKGLIKKYYICYPSIKSK
jgi:uncharacterized protein